MDTHTDRRDDFGYILGIDTSNYTTSMALIDTRGTVICDSRKMLKVKQGEKGLRQSIALFQHIDNLPVVADRIMENNGIEPADIKAVAYSKKPRPVEGSYMPVFKAGESFARSFSTLNKIPCLDFSHQEGHIEAVKHGSIFDDDKKILAFHLSGGTCELLSVKSCEKPGYSIEIIGGSKDISFGQLFDRIGVYLGYDFPAGGALDKIVSDFTGKPENIFKPVHTDGLYFNLSGLETGFYQKIKKDYAHEKKSSAVSDIFRKTAECLVKITERAAKETGITKILFSGGVSSSETIRKIISDYFENKNISILFGSSELSKDNAVGVALLGRKALLADNI